MGNFIRYKCRNCGDYFKHRDGYPLPAEARICWSCRFKCADLQQTYDEAIDKALGRITQ